MSRRKKSVDEQVRQALLELAVGGIGDAVSLLYLSDEEVMAKLPKLNLINISEIKRPKAGGMEIKFFDRIKACERLGGGNDSSQDKGLSFYEALEKGAETIRLEQDVDD